MTRFLCSVVFLWAVGMAGTVWGQSLPGTPVRPPSPPADPESVYAGGAFEEVVIDERNRLFEERPYSGIVPGRDEPEPGDGPATGPLRVERVGFEQRELFSRVFVLSDRPTTPWVYDNFVQAQASESVPFQIFVELPDAQVATRNDRRPLMTRAFNTPVAVIETRPTENGVRVVITLKREARYLPVQAGKVLYIDVER